MPAITERLPDATTKLISTAAPNSNDASMTFRPLGETVMAKNPPPAKNATARRNGFSRVAKKNRNSSDSPMNGTDSSAPRWMFESEKMPIGRSGIARSKPALSPLGAMSRYGGSLNPSNGMISLSVSTNASGPRNSMPFASRSATLTSGLRPGITENSMTETCTAMNSVVPSSCRVNGGSEHVDERRRLAASPAAPAPRR